MDEWHLSIAGKDYGPYSLEKLGQYAKEGRISPDDFIWKNNFPNWLEARQVPELAGFFPFSEISEAVAETEYPTQAAAKKQRKKELLRRPLFWIIFILILAYLAAVAITNLPYIYL